MGRKAEEDRGARLRKAAMLSSVGLVLVCATCIGYFSGAWLDKRLGTEYLMPLVTMLGVAAGFVEMFQIAAKCTRK